MHLFSSIDWGFLEAFFGEWGKVITTAVGLVVGVITLAIVLIKYLRAKILQKERDEARAERQQSKADLEAERAQVQRQQQALEAKEIELNRKDSALKIAAVRLTEQEQEIKSREHKLNEVRAAFIGKEHDLWCIHEPRKPENYAHKLWLQRHKPIITVANLKGGVGKTTLTANLAAFFSQAGKKVLLIDVDYQGSLSNMLLSADQVLEVSPEINRLLEHGADATTFMRSVRPFKSIIAGSAIISAKYEFASFENRMMIEYLLQEDQDDGRYRLANLLLHDEVSATFDIVLIDAPPRLTAGTINALCASTHVLIPTVFDNLSAETVGTFLNGVQVLKSHLNHRLDLLGVVGMLTSQQGALNAREQHAKNIAADEVNKTWGANHHFFNRHIPRKAAIAAAAGESLAYLCDATVKGWFDELGREIVTRLNLLDRPPQVPEPRRGKRAKQPVLESTEQEHHGVNA